MKSCLKAWAIQTIFSVVTSVSVVHAMDQQHSQPPLCNVRAAMYFPVGTPIPSDVKNNMSIYPDYATAVAFSPTQKLVAAGIVLVEQHKHYPFLALFDAQTGEQQKCLASIAQGLVKQESAQWSDTTCDDNAPTSITCIHYADDGKEVAIGRRDGCVYVYDGELVSLLRACNGAGEISSLAWSMSYKNGTYPLVIGSARRSKDRSRYEAGYVSILWQKKEKEFNTPECTYPRLCALSDETIAVAEGNDAGVSERLISIYDYEGQKVTVLERTDGGAFIFKDIAYDSCTHKMVGAGMPLVKGQTNIYVFNPTAQGKGLHWFWKSGVGCFGMMHKPYGRYEGLKIAINDAGTTLAVVNPSAGANCWGTVNIYDIQSGNCLHTHDIQYVKQVSLSADGALLATVDVNGISIRPAIGASVPAICDYEDEGVTF